MMYVRTKNGVYEVVGFNEECIIPSILIKVKNNYGKEKITHCCKGDILNKSENLDELCDAFATVRKNASGIYSVFFIELEDWKTWINGYDIYGAIWCEFGLKYVAKMDNEGKLELI